MPSNIFLTRRDHRHFLSKIHSEGDHNLLCSKEQSSKIKQIPSTYSSESPLAQQVYITRQPKKQVYITRPTKTFFLAIPSLHIAYDKPFAPLKGHLQVTLLKNGGPRLT
ncbi:hypothetical protein O6H91_04G026200 [Diphasiastrum complanatum]|uniref:Uncharacterized protein n=1 Tax=Diphasiastrum complanatum TaxID=34168 RepID=A0ACC2DVG8_DIPCM|nr:hypothetical protein O6H91_04G026200 [Diphasiastrum complanatum]